MTTVYGYPESKTTCLVDDVYDLSQVEHRLQHLVCQHLDHQPLQWRVFTIGWSLIKILQLDWLFGFNPSCRPGNASSPDCTQPSVNKHDYQSDEDDRHHVTNNHYHNYHEDGYDQLLRLSRSPSDNNHCIYPQVAGMLHTAGNYTFDSCQTIRSDPSYSFGFVFTSSSQFIFPSWSANFPAVSF